MEGGERQAAAGGGAARARPTATRDDEAELYFLIADFLKRRSACQNAADVLIEELATHELLGQGVDWRGRPKAKTYQDFHLRHRDIGAGHLLQLLRGAVGAAKPAAAADDASDASAAITSDSLLLKSRVDERTHVAVSDEERKHIAKQIVRQLFALRRNVKTQRVVQQVIKKYERLQQYMAVPDANQLPADLLAQVLTNDADKVTALAADVRALKQLFQLRKEKDAIEAELRSLTEQGSRARVFRSTSRVGRNQASLIKRREVSSRKGPSLVPAYIYSRIRRLKTLNGHLQIQTYCLTYDKTGKFVITGADDRLIKIWSLETGDLKFTLRGHVGNITDLAVNDSNTLLASSSDDKTVRVWELSTGAPVAVLLGHSSIVNSVRFHPKKNVVVTASDDGRCFCYILPDIPRVDEPETRLETAKRLFNMKAYLLSLHPMYSLSHGLRQGSRSNKVLCLSFSRCGKYVVTGGEDNIARVWDMSILSDPHAPAVIPRYQPTDEPGERVLQPDTTVNIVLPTPELPNILANIDANAAPNRDVMVNGLNTPAQAPEVPGTQPSLSLQDGLDRPIFVPPVTDEISQGPITGTPLPAPTLGTEPAPAPMPVPATVEAPQQSQVPQLPQDNASIVTIEESEIPRLPNSEPIALLKGHSGPITNIIFSHVGDQIATASIKDGSTRIWKVTKNYQRMKSIVLEPEDPDNDDALARLYGVQTRRKARPSVDTLMWTHDDQRLITLHSIKPGTHSVDGDWRQRIKVWNPMNGKLMMTLGAIDPAKKYGHINAVFAMDVHPTDWRVVVTAGYDGRVFLWDISTGRMLKSFANMSPDSKQIPMLDGGFMPDGSGFCFTDQIGRLLIFGTGSGEQYAPAPVQQYFRRDYAVLITDRHMNVRDRETQQLPSLMESGPLVDIYRIEYPHQPPHLLANGSSLTVEQLEENRRQRIEQAKESEIKCRVRHLPEDEEDIDTFPLAVCPSPSKRPKDVIIDDVAAARALATSSFRLNGAPVALSELRRRPSLIGSHRIGRLERRRSATSLEERDTSVLEMEISSDDDRSDEDFQVPAQRAANDGDDEDEEEDEDEDEDEEDELDEDDLLSDNDDAVVSPSNFRRRRLRSARHRANSPANRFPTRGGRRLVEASEETEGRAARRLRRGQRSSMDLGEDQEAASANRGDHSELGADDSRSSPERMSGSENVIVESNDGFIMGDNQLDKFDLSTTYEDMLDAKRRQLGTSRENTTENGEEALIPCAFCGEGDDGGLLKLPGEMMGIHPLINGSQRLFVHDQCAIASPLCFQRNTRWYNVTREIRRGRSLPCVQCKKRGATVGCTIPSCPRSYHWKCAVSCGWSLNQMQFYCPTHEAQRGNSGNRRGDTSPSSSDTDVEPVARRFGLAYHREWLQLVSLKATHQYVPQVGDYVVYFPEGHLSFLRYGELRQPSYFARLGKFYAVKCRVVDVKYKFPLVAEYAKCSTIKCEISLAVLAVPASQTDTSSETQNEIMDDEEETKEEERGSFPSLFDPENSVFAKFVSVDLALLPESRETSSPDSGTPRFQFKMTYYSNDVANFLVLDHVFDNGVRADWKIGDRVRMPYVQLDSFGLETGSKMSYGKIESIVPKEIEGPNGPTRTPWECITVNWDSPDDDTCAVCPWELEHGLPEVLQEKHRLAIGRPSTRLFLSRLITAEKRDVLSQVVDQIMTLSISRDFIYPVDESFLDYLITVPNPIDLTKIRQRLRLGYYRQVEAFIADAKLLSINCETYNISSSSIAQNSRSLYSSLLTEAQRHFPHLLAGNGGDAPRELSYPPNDYVTNFPQENEDDQIAHLIVDVSEAGYSEPNVLTPAAREESVSETLAVSTSIIEPSSAPQESPARRVLRNSAAGRDASQLQSPSARATRSPTTPSRNTKSRAGPSHRSSLPASSPAAISPQSLRSPPAGGRPRRVTREVSVAVPESPDPKSKPTRKRQRDASSTELEVVTLDELLERLTDAQRELFTQACEEDLASVLQDFHEALMQVDEYDVFANPVTEDIAPEYFSIVTTPMDFGTINGQLAQYSTFREYYDDVYLTFSNAIKYNTWEGPIGELVAELQKYSVKFLLDAIGADHAGVGNSGSTRRAVAQQKARTAKASGGSARQRSAALGKRRARSIISDEDNEDSWGSNFSESSSNDDEDDEEEEEEEAESDDSRRRGRKSHSKPKRRRR